MEPDPEQTALYKAFHDGKLVYNGVSKSVLRRISEHQWVEPTSIEVEYHPSREDAELEERRLIRETNPVYNIMHAQLESEKRSRRLQKKVHRGGDAAEIIKRARRLSGMTQQEMALKLGTFQQAISKYETARMEPTLPTLKMLLAACDLEMRVHLVPVAEE